jgi:hypothetical protein
MIEKAKASKNKKKNVTVPEKNVKSLKNVRKLVHQEKPLNGKDKKTSLKIVQTKVKVPI